MSPAEQAWMPEASRDRSLGTFAKKYWFTSIWHTPPERHDSRHRALRKIHAGLNSGSLPPEHDEPGSHCTPTAGARFCRGPMARAPRVERHLPQQTHRSQPRDSSRCSNPRIPGSQATEVAIPRAIGPRQRWCEQGHAVNRWPSLLSSPSCRGLAFRHRACEEQSRPSAFTPHLCD